MISILNSNANYVFPETIPLTKCMKDYLEDEVDEKWYINNPKAKALIEKLLAEGRLEDLPTNKPLGNIPPLENDKIHQRNFVYNELGVAPTLTHTMFKDSPRVFIECERLGNIYRENAGGNFAGNTYSPNGLCPTINCCGGGNREPMIVEAKEVVCVASRGRNVDNPSDRRPGIELEQRLEPNQEGICNCLTSVSKDAMVLEIDKNGQN